MSKNTITCLMMLLWLTSSLSVHAEKVAIKKEKKICKNSAPTGSRIGKKICLSKSAWDEMKRKARDSLDSSTKPTSNNRKGQ